MKHDHLDLAGTRATIVVHRWPKPQARYVALISHGIAEHAERYGYVAARLIEHGATVYAPDHYGHGRSGGEPGLVDDLDSIVEDLHLLAERASADNPGLPTVLIGHSMGGLIAARYAQLHGDELAALVLSAPAVAGDPDLLGLLDLDPIPDVPIDPAILSRDPSVGQAYAADPLIYHGPLLRTTLETLVGEMRAVADGPTLGALPTLWIHGTEDALVPLEHARPAVERIRGERFDERIYPGARHEVFNETNKDEVIGDVIAFLDRTLPARPA
jgi:alpha-beta hydrolase superfamily lysophospholipase